MDLLKKPVRSLYFKYLSAAFGSALVGAVYIFADMAIIGQYEGPNGTAAMAIVLPVWSLICSLGILTGIGGSVLYSAEKGRASDREKPNAIFSAAILMTLVMALLVWALILLFDRQLLTFLGAQDTAEAPLLTLALTYLKPLKPIIPLSLFNQTLAAFLRNDDDPSRATLAVVSTALLNIVLDYLFAFPLDMGIYGAALAAALCTALSVAIMLTHFTSPKNTLKLVNPQGFARLSRQIARAGFSAFFMDIAMGLLNIMYNRQVLLLFGTDALSVYGAIASLCTVVQSCSYSIGQAAQPILSTNYGAGETERVQETVKYAIETALVFGLFWLTLTMAAPTGVIRLMMAPTPQVLALAPSIVRPYCLSFLLTPFNLFAIYYFQSVMQPTIAFAASVLRGLVISGLLIFLLPAILGPSALWYAMPLTELIVALGLAWAMTRSFRGKAKNDHKKPQSEYSQKRA